MAQTVHTPGPSAPGFSDNSGRFVLVPVTTQAVASFRYLEHHVAGIKPSSSRDKTETWIVQGFRTQLQAEFHDFKDTLSELLDSHQWTEDSLEPVDERLLHKRCGCYYGKYVSALWRIIGELREIALSIGMKEDEAPWLKTTIPLIEQTMKSYIAKPQTSGDDGRWVRLVQAVANTPGLPISISMEGIKRANQELEEIKKQTNEPPPRSIWNQLSALRSHWHDVADTLGDEAGFSCQEDCRNNHKAFLRVKKGFEGVNKGEDIQFRDEISSLVFHNSGKTDGVHWKWAEVQSQFIGTDETKTSATPFDTMSSESLPTPAKPQGKKAGSRTDAGLLVELKSVLKKDNKGKGSKASQSSVMFLGLSQILKGKSKGASGKSRPSLITEPSTGLCAFFHDCEKSQRGSDFDSPGRHILIYCAENENKLQLSINSSETDLGMTWSDPFSIRDRLGGLTSDPVMPTEQKLQLAHKVASGLLYAYATQWMKDTWASEDVYLVSGAGGGSLIEPLLAKHPQANSGSASIDKGYETLSAMELSLVHLGRFLIELYYGVPWEQIRRAFLRAEDEEFGLNADIIASGRIFSKVGWPTVATNDQPFYQEGNSYVSAVRSCFTRDFGQRSGSLDDLDFRLGIYTYIILPLFFAVEDFQARQLRIYGPRIEIPESLKLSGNQAMLFDDDDKISGNVELKHKYADTWMEHLGTAKKVAGHIRKRPNTPEDRIRVAILDTGVDIYHDDLNELWTDSRIFYQNFAPGGASEKVPQDDHGHGTHVTSILMSIAEYVNVYVARVSSKGYDWDSALVEKAINWAVQDKNVHIISLSFGFPNIDQSLEPIRRAILKAHAADVLVFAAMGNRGVLHPIAFPASMDEVISVGSVNGNHELSDFMPHLDNVPEGKRLCAIGEGIHAAWKGPTLGKRHSKKDRRAGTSYATPVAAGVAAMLLDAVWSRRSVHSYECQKLRSKRGMLKALGSFMVEGKNAESLVPWALFNENSNKTTSDANGSQRQSGVVETIIGAMRNV